MQYLVISNEVRDLPKRTPQIPTPAPQALDDNDGHVTADYYGQRPHNDNE